MEVFTGLGLPLGEAFQLRDDLLDVFGSADGACAPGLSDLREGKRTVLLALGLQNADLIRHFPHESGHVSCAYAASVMLYDCS
jgi:geranylgeranyl diphosphate synthase type I